MAIVAYIDMLTVRSNPSARSKRRYSRSSCYSEGKKEVQGCVSQNSDPMNSILQKVEELGLNASAGHTWNSQDAPGTKLKFGWKKRTIWRNYPERWTSWAKSLRAWFWGSNIWGNLTTSRLYQQSSVEFGLKIWSSNLKTITFYSLVKAPETQNIVCLLWIRELQCTMQSKGDLSSDTMDTLRRSKNPICDRPRPGTVQINEKAQVFVHDPDLFVTVQLLDKTPAILLLH